MEISHDFYEDEIRCDFYIPSMVKRTWAVQMEILSDIDEACKKGGLSYFAEWGTLLGTVRHGGFIPWDDDMDICMKRRDYNSLTRNISAYLPDNYSIVNYRSSRDFKQMLSRVVNSDHYRFDTGFLHKYSGIPFAMGLDIFPLDFLTDDDEYEEARKMRVNLVYEAVNEMTYFDTSVKKLETRLCAIEKVFGVRIDRRGDVLTYLRGLLEKAFSEVEEKDAKYITLYPLWLSNSSFKFPVSWYENSVRMRFETMTIPVPAGYDEILKKKYGSGFMNQVRSGGAHEYPCYDLHVNVLRDSFGFEWPSYRFNSRDMCMPRDEKTGGGGSAVFLTYSRNAFENMRSYAAMLSESGYEVTILPVKKYEIAPDMTGVSEGKERTEEQFFTEGIRNAKVTYDPSVLDSHPDIIVTNFGYDEYNLIIAVDKIFYSRSLRGLTDLLVYIPPYEAETVADDDERSRKLLPSYACLPVACACDRIVLHSENMKKRYIECLDGFSGNEFRDIWEKKIVVCETRTDGGHEGRREKKKVLFCFGISPFACHGESAIEKIKKVMGIFEDNSEKVEVVFLPKEGFFEELEELYPHLFEKYKSAGLPVRYDRADMDDIDAYYGEASYQATQLLGAGKPVMIWDC